MGMLDWFRRVFGAELAREEYTSAAFQRLFSNRIIPRKGVRELLIAYSELPPLRSITNRIGQSIASTMWEPVKVTNPKRVRHMTRRLTYGQDLERRDKEIRSRKQTGELQELDHHPVLDLLENPNPAMTGRAHLLLHQITMELVGENFWIVETDGQGIPTQLLSIPPSWVTVVPNPIDDGGFFKVSWPSGVDTNIPAANMIWFRDPSPADPYGRGVGTAGALSDELSTDEQAAKVALQRFINGGSPEIIIGIKGVSDQEVEEFQDRIRKDYRGWQRTALTWATNGEVSIQKIGASFADMELTEQRKATQSIIRETWGLPPEILGIVENCHDEATECMTRRGWLSFDEITLSDEIGTVEDDGRFRWECPAELHVYDHDGPLHFWENGRVDVAVTAGHRMWLRGHHKGAPMHYETADEAAERAVMYWQITGGRPCVDDSMPVKIPHVPYGATGKKGNDSGAEIEPDAFAPFLGYWISEGWMTAGRGFSIRYAQSAGAVADKMHTAFNRLGLGEVRRYERANVVGGGTRSMLTYSLPHKSLWHWLFQHVGKGAANKRLPECVFTWPESAQRALLDAMVEGDGWIFNKHGTFGLASISKRLIDDAQRLGVMLGYRVSIGQKTAATETSQTLFQAIFSHRSEAYVRQRAHRTEHYKGKTWCVTVPAGRFFTRRNGQVALHGNSNRATIDAAMFLYTTLAITPRQVQLASDLNVNLMPRYQDNTLLIPESQVPEDKEHKLKTMKGLPSAFKISQWQETAGFIPIETDEGGDLYVIPLGVETRPLVPPEGEEEVEVVQDEPEPSPEPEEPPEPDEDEASRAVVVSSAHEFLRSPNADLSPFPCVRVVDLLTKDPVDDRVQAIVERLKPEALINSTEDLWSDELKQWITRTMNDLGVEVSFEILNPLIVESLREFAGDRITGLIHPTSIDKLRKTLVEGVRAGEDIRKLTKRVEETFDGFSKARATSIARTEVLRSSNQATFQSFGLSGIVDLKEWIGTPDDRVRDDHDPGISDSLDGQVQQLNNPFVITRGASENVGATAMHPGGFGIAAQDLMCRCSLAAVILDPLEEERTPRTVEERAIIWREFDAHAEAWETRAEAAFRKGFRAQESQMIQILEEAFPSVPE